MSREIDIRNSVNARIAREIMGWTDNWRTPGGSAQINMWGIMDWYSPTEPVRAANFPSYDDDIEAAWTVVDKLMESNFMVSVNCSHESGWWCVVYPPTGDCIESEYCPDAPSAICAAALACFPDSPNER